MTVRIEYRLCILMFTLALTACTTQNWYQGMQASHEARCMQEPISEYEECMKQTDDSYDEYQENRQQLKTEPASR